MSKYIVLLFILTVGVNAIGQPNFANLQTELKQKLELLARERTDSLKLIRNLEFKLKFKETLETQGSFLFNFDSLQTLGKLISSDQLVKVYTWNIHFNTGEHIYYGFIQHKNKKSDNIALWELTDKSSTIAKPAGETLTNENWFGALYYEIITTKKGKNLYYLLLGWDGNTDFSTKKLIEPLTFDAKGKPKFGASVFVLQKGNYKRIIFEYSKRASMVLKYDKNLKMIVFDHLSPAEPKYKDNYTYYGPDFSFDAFKLKKGKWHYTPDVDARNPKKK